MTRDKALRLRQLIQTAAAGLSDKDASECPEFFGGMKYDGSLIAVNTRIRWGNGLKRARVDLWDAEQDNPDNAPTLWEDVAYRDGIRIIPENIPSTDPFHKGELGWWGEDLYESVPDGVNIYTPAQYPPNWKKVEVSA